MTRFDATDPADRRKLYVDAITAHRERGSGFCTIEVDESVLESDDDPGLEAESEDADIDADADHDLDPELGVPWIQFGDGTINLDCTDAELDDLKDVLGEFPAFKIDEIIRPEEADGVNVRVSAKADRNRIAQFVDAVFRRVYGLPETFRVWVAEI